MTKQVIRHTYLTKSSPQMYVWNHFTVVMLVCMGAKAEHCKF